MIIILMFSVMVLLALVMCSGDAESQERDLLGSARSGPMGWGDAGVPVIAPVRVVWDTPGKPFHVRWWTGANGHERKRVAPACPT